MLKSNEDRSVVPMKDYAIMHLNRHVATIRGDGSCRIHFPRFMPFNLYLERTETEDLSVRMNNLNNFYYWCATRLLTLDRKYAKEVIVVYDDLFPLTVRRSNDQFEV